MGRLKEVLHQSSLRVHHLRFIMQSLVSSNRMHRGIHISVSLLAVFLLLKPFDCFSGGKFTKEAADCCKRGKCRPSTGDDCCKGTLPGGKEIVAASKIHQHQSPVALPMIGSAPNAEFVFLPVAFHEPSPPPGSPPGSRLNLPLLI